MKQEDINKLPPDVKKDFMKYAIKLAEKKTQSAAHDDFLTFTKHVWPEFIEGKHHKIIAEKFNRLAKGEVKRLIINMPPRHTKSEFKSGLRPTIHAGSKLDANSDLVCLGGMLIIILLHSPLAKRLNFSAIFL